VPLVSLRHTDLCRERYEQFGSAGRTAGIRPIPLGEMARRYANDDLR
jgi:fructose-bisphosphate aldolase class II